MPRTLRTMRAYEAGSRAFIQGTPRGLPITMGPAWPVSAPTGGTVLAGGVLSGRSPAPGPQPPGTVDARVAGEVRRDGFRGDLPGIGERGHRVRVEPEAAVVVGEVQHAVRREP